MGIGQGEFGPSLMVFTGSPRLCSGEKRSFGGKRLGFATGEEDQWMGTLYRVVGNFLGSGVAQSVKAASNSRHRER